MGKKIKNNSEKVVTIVQKYLSSYSPKLINTSPELPYKNAILHQCFPGR